MPAFTVSRFGAPSGMSANYAERKFNLQTGNNGVTPITSLIRFVQHHEWCEGYGPEIARQPDP